MPIWTQAFDCAPAQLEDYLQATALSHNHDLQYFDALIITVAARAGATMLLSEDMQDGLEVAGLRVVDPFLAGNAGVIAGGFGGVIGVVSPELSIGDGAKFSSNYFTRPP